MQTRWEKLSVLFLKIASLDRILTSDTLAREGYAPKARRNETSIRDLCAIRRGTAAYLTGDRRSNRPEHRRFSLFTGSFLLLFDSLFIACVTVRVSFIHGGLFRNPFSFSGQRIPSVNLDVSLSRLASLNSSLVFFYSLKQKTPVNSEAQRRDVTHLFSADAFSGVSHLCVLIHICVPFI